VRPATPVDVPGIHRLIRELAGYERSLHEMRAAEADLSAALFGPFRPGQAPAIFAHVAEHGGTVAGYALWFVSYSTWTGRHGIYLEDLYVTPGLRNHGLGRALLASLARICATRGYARLDWVVLDWNAPALKFFSAVGAQRLGQWAPHRLEGTALAALAGHAPSDT
jgi:GNAT superfamily N-acetyltransferase